MSLIRMFTDVYSREGWFYAVWRTFGYFHERFIRPKLPPKEVKTSKLNGIMVLYPNARLFDNLVGLTNYEGPLIRGMKQSIDPGDEVVIVGGGYAVSAIMASRLTGETGDVTVYEGSREMVDNIRCSTKLHEISNIHLVHAIVSDSISLYGAPGDAEKVSPSNLPECDVLVLDCEGAELGIIADLCRSPTSLIVETHGKFGSPPEEIKRLLVEQGYRIIHEFVMSESNGLEVLVSELSSSS